MVEYIYYSVIWGSIVDHPHVVHFTGEGEMTYFDMTSSPGIREEGCV